MRRPRLAPTRTALHVFWLGTGLLGAAVNTGNNLIYLTFSLLAASFLVSVAAALANARRLVCELRPPSAPVVGSPFAIELSVTNRGRRVARAVEFSLVTDQGTLGPVLVERIAGNDSVRVGFAGRGARRGVLQIAGIEARSTHPLGLVRRRFFAALPAGVFVLPRARRAAALSRAGAGDAGSTGRPARVPGTEYHGLRRGGGIEDARRVDWKVTARRGTVMVRETVGESRAELHLSLETRVPGEPATARRRFEDELERVAGRARAALLDRGPVRLSVDGAPAAIFAGENDLPRLLRTLAALEPCAADGTALPPLPLAVGALGGTRTGRDSARETPPGRTQRISSLVAVAIGTAALFAFDAVGAAAFVALAAGTLLTAFVPRAVAGAKTLAGRLWKIAAITNLVFFFVDLIWLRHDLLGSSSNLLVFVTLLALFNARDAEDDRRLLLISLVQVVLAASLTTELAFLLPLAAWLFAAVHASIAGAALPDAKRASCAALFDPAGRSRLRYAIPTAVLTPTLLAAAALVFAVVPHLGTGTFRPNTLRRQTVSGFSETTRLGDIGRIKLDESKVMEVEVDSGAASDDDLKWRGVALTHFDGRNWTRDRPSPEPLAADDRGRLRPGGNEGVRPPTRARTLVQNVRLELADTNVLFAAASAKEIVSRDFRRLAEDSAGNLELLRTPGRRVSYAVTSELPPRDPAILRAAAGDDPRSITVPNLELPRLDPRIRSLAREITAGTATRYDAARAIESRLATGYEYSLDVADSGASDPLARFLFEGMPGHCEYFATAMVVLARSQGIPTRFVAGYLRGQQSRFARRYLVRQSDAHSWVEVHFPGVGWVAFDPTPPAGRTVSEAPRLTDLASFLYSSATRLWDDYVAGLDLDDQGRAVFALLARGRTAIATVAGWPWHLWAGALAAVLSLIGAGRWLRRRRRTTAGEAVDDPLHRVPAFYLQLLEMLGARGLTRRPQETPVEFAERARASVGRRCGERLVELTRLYYRVRFDGVTAEGSVRRIARALLEDVQAELRMGVDLGPPVPFPFDPC